MDQKIEITGSDNIRSDSDTKENSVKEIELVDIFKEAVITDRYKRVKKKMGVYYLVLK